MDQNLRLKIALHIIRAVFFASSVGLGLYIAEHLEGSENLNTLNFMLAGAAISLSIILVEIYFSKSDIVTISSIVFGLLSGFIMSYLFIGVIHLIVDDLKTNPQFLSFLKLILTLIFCYFGITVLLQTQKDFRFIIPYVEFRRTISGFHPLILDTSAIIDGRFIKLCEKTVFDNQILLPEFVIHELQKLADSPDKTKREQGRRGLDMLQKLKAIPTIHLEFFYEDFPQLQDVDKKLIQLAQQTQGKIVTNDYNLQKVSNLNNIQVININEIAKCLRPEIFPGDKLRLNLIRPGEEKRQALGYLPDGTLVVVDNAADEIGKEVDVVVRNIHQTQAGKMIFAFLKKNT